MNYRRNLTTLRRPCGLGFIMDYRERFAVKPAVTVQSGRIDSNDKGGHDDTDSAKTGDTAKVGTRRRT